MVSRDAAPFGVISVPRDMQVADAGMTSLLLGIIRIEAFSDTSSSKSFAV